MTQIPGTTQLGTPNTLLPSLSTSLIQLTENWTRALQTAAGELNLENHALLSATSDLCRCGLCACKTQATDKMPATKGLAF